MQVPVAVQRAAESALEHLDITHPKFHGSDHVRKVLSEPGTDLYLRTWVLPCIEAIVTGDIPERMRKKRP